MLLVVMALMMVMLVGGVTSAAFARLNQFGCIQRTGFFLIPNADQFPNLVQKDRNGDNIICGYVNNKGNAHFTDNHPHWS